MKRREFGKLLGIGAAVATLPMVANKAFAGTDFEYAGHRVHWWSSGDGTYGYYHFTKHETYNIAYEPSYFPVVKERIEVRSPRVDSVATDREAIAWVHGYIDRNRW